MEIAKVFALVAVHLCNLDANTFQFVWQFLPCGGQSSAVSAPIYLERYEYVLILVQVGLKLSERIQMSLVYMGQILKWFKNCTYIKSVFIEIIH